MQFGDVTGILVRSGNMIDGIQVSYGKTKGQFHGGSGGEPHYFALKKGERII